MRPLGTAEGGDDRGQVQLHHIREGGVLGGVRVVPEHAHRMEIAIYEVNDLWISTWERGGWRKEGGEGRKEGGEGGGRRGGGEEDMMFSLLWQSKLAGPANLSA